MHLTDDLRKSSQSKLLPFRSLSPVGHAAKRGTGEAPGMPLELSLDPEQVSHEVGMLRRPLAVDFATLPQMQEQEGLAHDARNLMTSLELISGLLAQPGVLPDEHKHYAGDLQSLAKPLASLIERMAGAERSHGVAGQDARKESGRSPGKEPLFVFEPLRPSLSTGRQRAADPSEAGLVVKSCERLLAAIAGPSVALNISYERGLGELSLDGEALTRVLINLVTNAREAMPGGGRIAITVRKGLGARRCALVSVQDSGVGIPAHAMGQIFQAGFSSKKSRSKWPASAHHGLGLTIVRDLVEDAGGSVRVVSTLRKGTTFEIKLPCSLV